MNNPSIPYAPPSWHELYMRHVYLIATKSKDQRTKVGAVLVKDNRIISEGFNGICRKVNDNVPEREERPEKYFWYEHAERNSVYNCAFHGISSLGSTLYTQGFPCCDCARSVLQGGIKSIVLHKQWMDIEENINREKWVAQAVRTKVMFEEAGIEVIVYDKLLITAAYLDGQIFTV